MSNLFLLNASVDLDNIVRFKAGVSELITIEKEKDDAFHKHESIWSLQIIHKLYQTFGQTEQAIIQYLSQLESCENCLTNEAELQEYFPTTKNAFLGIDFDGLSINSNIQVYDNLSYKKFKYEDLWSFNNRTVWDKREKLFPNLVLCGEVEQQLLKIGDSSHFNQIIDRLTEFNKAVKGWKKGEFSYKLINRAYPLRISPESDKTLDKYKSDRVFSLPKGGTRVFDLHIKTGDLRFHFYPDETDFKVYVGYIGPHLPTVSN